MELPNISDTVIYGTHGICKITEIKEQSFGAEHLKYFVLKPVYEKNTTFFVPVENELAVNKMKRVMSAKEIYDVIDLIPSQEHIWIENEAERKGKYFEIIKKGDRKELVRLIKTLYAHKERQIKCGKKLRSSDEKFLLLAQKILHEEFAYVLNITQEQVIPFICEKLKVEEKSFEI